MDLKASDNVDGWTLIELLGRGGNGVVWRAEREDFGDAALKVLLRRDGDRWQRFCDEISILRQLGDYPGVLPLIDANLPDPRAGVPAWLAAPIAQSVADALGDEPSLSKVVETIRAYALTLADLASREIGHRDLKPDNLFCYEGRWVVGDFGLVSYPGKTPITSGKRRLGPLYFMAPEMLREPDAANAGPADVFSLAKTLWVLASGQRYPPEGQIRSDMPDHNLGRWTECPGTIALGLLLEQATSSDPDIRPTMAEFAAQLQSWTKGGSRQDDDAAQHIRQRYVERLGDNLAQTVDSSAFLDTEALITEKLSTARQRSEEKRRDLRTGMMRDVEAQRQAYMRNGGAKAALNLLESAWIGSQRDGDEFVDAVLAQPLHQRTHELDTARKILWGRPLWWLHTVLLTASLALRGQEGCDPLATEIATEEMRHHLLEFRDHAVLAAFWQLQRELIPLVARGLASTPLDQFSDAIKSSQSEEDRIRYDIGPSKLFGIAVSEVVRRQLRQFQPWTIEAFNLATVQARELLTRLPIPSGPWLGPIADPWLQSWGEMSPLLMCGLAVLSSNQTGDDLLATDHDLQNAILEAAKSEFQLLRRPAIPLAERLGLLRAGTGAGG